MNHSPPVPSISTAHDKKLESENDLVDRALNADESAYSELIRLYRSKVAATVYSILGRDFVEEISHEAFVRAFNSIKRYRRDSSFYTYLIRITVNLCRDEIRRKQIRKIFSFTEVFSKDEDNSYQEQVQSATSGSPASIYDSEETVRIVREEMENLPSILRVAVTMREIDELSYDEIAKLLKISVGTAKTRVFRGRQVLRSRLARRLNYEE